MQHHDSGADLDGAPGPDIPRERLMHRIEELEARLAIHEDITATLIKERVAGAVHSIGVVVDYLETLGVVDKSALQDFIERNHRVIDVHNTDRSSRPALDVYQWLTWRHQNAARPSGRRDGAKPASALEDAVTSLDLEGAAEVLPI